MTVAHQDRLLQKKRYLRALILSVVLAGVGYIGFSLWGGWRDVVLSVSEVGAAGIIIALSLSLVNYALRFIRWQGYLALLGHRIPWSQSLRIYLSGFALTTTPAKAGEALRSVFLKPLGVSYAESLGALFSERLSDLIAMLLLASIGLWIYSPARPVVVILGIVAFALVIAIQKADRLRALSALSHKLPRLLNNALASIVDMISHARSCFRFPVMLAGLLLGLMAWGAEGVAFYYIWDFISSNAILQDALFVYAFSMLIGAVSFLPGGLGGTEVTMVTLLLLHGTASPQAVAITLAIRLATLWFAVVIGILALPHKFSR